MKELLILFAVITLKLATFPHPTGEFIAWFEIPNFIMVYDVDSLSEEEYHDILVHEYVHYLAWNLFGVHPQDHTTYFTGNGKYLID